MNWPVSGPVEFAVDDGIQGLMLTDSDGNNIPLQFVAEDCRNRSTSGLQRHGRPACGFKTYYLRRVAEGGLAALNANDAAKTSPAIANEFQQIVMRPKRVPPQISRA